jgi:hypothetical protein
MRRAESAYGGPEASLRLAEAKGRLSLLGEPYVRALALGLRARAPFLDPEQTNVAIALADVVDIAPSVAVAAFRGCAGSDDASERAAAAISLPFLASQFPDIAACILADLLKDLDYQVVNHARDSARALSAK